MAAQKLRHLARAFGGGGHPELQGFERAHQQPAGVGIAHRAEDRAHAAYRLERRGRSRAAARDQIGMAAYIFSERGHNQISAMGHGCLIQGPEQRVVDDDRRALSIFALEAVGKLSGAANVDEAVGRIGRRLEIKRRERTDRARPAHRFLHRPGPALRRKLDRGHAELRQDPLQEKIGAAVDRARMNDDRAGPRIGPKAGRNRGHARGECQIGLGLVPDRQPVLEHFEIGVVDPAVDKARLLVRPLLTQAIGQLEEGLAVLGGAENES